MKLQHRFEVFKGADNQFYFRCIHKNKQIKFVSEGYTRIGNAVDSLNGFMDDMKANSVPVILVPYSDTEKEVEEREAEQPAEKPAAPAEMPL